MLKSAAQELLMWGGTEWMRDGGRERGREAFSPLLGDD